MGIVVTKEWQHAAATIDPAQPPQQWTAHPGAAAACLEDSALGRTASACFLDDGQVGWAGRGHTQKSRNGQPALVFWSAQEGQGGCSI